MTTSAQQTMWRLKDQDLTDIASRNEYDRALGVYSICYQLRGQRFLWDREHLLAALNGLEVKADGVPFNAERFQEQWRDVVTVLIGRYT